MQTQEKFSYLRDLRVIEANRFCADCGAPDPEWGLMNLSVLICFECSGVHRSLGVHISKVRSLTLDEWNPELFHVCSQSSVDHLSFWRLLTFSPLSLSLSS